MATGFVKRRETKGVNVVENFDENNSEVAVLLESFKF